MHVNQVRLIDEFTKLVQIDSPSYGERQMGDYVKARLQKLGMTVIEDDAGEKTGGNCGNIYGYLEGDADVRPLLFCAHLDTVEPSKGKAAQLHKNGTITSRGDTVLGADDLTGVASILEALTVIVENELRHRPIEVLFTVAEEVYCRGSAVFDFSKLLSDEAYVLDLTGRVGTAAFAAPSILSFTAGMHGKSAHAGFAPEKGVHAIAAAADAVGKITMGHIDEETTVNVGMLQGGSATNVVPDSCVVKGEVRSLSHEKALQQAELVKNQFERSAADAGASVDFKLDVVSKAYLTPPNHRVAVRFEKACVRLGLPVMLIKTMGGSDNNVMAENGMTGLVVANAMNHCHALDEFTTVDELTNSAELTLQLMTAGD